MKKNIVFIIEDDTDIAKIYGMAINSSEIDVELIFSGEEAINKIKEIQEDKAEKPSIILLDLILPGVDGKEIFKTIKSNEKTKDIPVFITTNASLPEVDNIEADKIILKSNTTPSMLAELVKKQIKC